MVVAARNGGWSGKLREVSSIGGRDRGVLKVISSTVKGFPISAIEEGRETSGEKGSVGVEVRIHSLLGLFNILLRSYEL
jgi:hypothetical protein